VKIKARRNTTELKQNALVIKAIIPVPTLSRIECDVIESPTLTTA